MKVLSLLCPTRERPDLVERYIQSINNTATYPERCEVLLYVDNDDPKFESYIKVCDKTRSETPLKRIGLFTGLRKSISISWNDLAEQSLGDILIMGNDDLVFITKNWDVILEQESNSFSDDIYCLFFHDTVHNNPTFCAFPMVSRKWYETLGYFTPGVFNFQYNDTWISDLADRIGRKRKISDVVMEHRHWKTTKGKTDGTKEHTIAQQTLQTDGLIYSRPDMIDRRIADAKKLQFVMK